VRPTAPRTSALLQLAAWLDGLAPQVTQLAAIVREAAQTDAGPAAALEYSAANMPPDMDSEQTFHRHARAAGGEKRGRRWFVTRERWDAYRRECAAAERAKRAAKRAAKTQATPPPPAANDVERVDEWIAAAGKRTTRSA